MDKTSIKAASMQTGVRPSAAPTPSPLPSPQPEARRAKPGLIKQILAPVASLRLTVVLFVLALILVLAGTLAQIDHGIWTDIAILGHDCRWIDHRRRCQARNNRPCRVEGLRGESISPVRFLAYKQRHPRWRASGDLFVDKRRSGARANECLQIFPIFEKADIFRAGGFERTDIAK